MSDLEIVPAADEDSSGERSAPPHARPTAPPGPPASAPPEHRQLPETFAPDGAGLRFAFKEGWREHSELCDRQPDTEGGRQDQSVGLKVDGNRLRSATAIAYRALRGIGRTLRGTLIAFALLSVAMVGTLRWVDPPASSFMLRQAMIVRGFGRPPPYYEYRWMPLKAMPPSVPLAVIAAEDQRFATHHGFDMIEIRKAWADFRLGGRLRGASTITQQTAKNLFLWPERSWWRKGLEIWFGTLLELFWPKARILEVYLNIAQFGPGTYGIAAASERYFKHPAQSLTLGEASLMAGVLPAPGRYRLDKPSAQLLRRARWIADQTQRIGGQRYLKQL